MGVAVACISLGTCIRAGRVSAAPAVRCQAVVDGCAPFAIDIKSVMSVTSTMRKMVAIEEAVLIAPSISHGTIIIIAA